MKQRFFIIVLISVFFMSCQNEFMTIPVFNVAIDSSEYYTGDIITFDLHGNPDIISFYPGVEENELAVPIKSVAQVTPADFTYTYNISGDYKVTFLAANSSIYGRVEVIKTLNITIKPKNNN